jgi:hypothetical protein
MSEFQPPADRDPDNPVHIEPAEINGIRSWVIYAPSLPQLNQQVALILSEHLRDDDELHVSHAVVQSGWTNHAPQPANVIPPRRARDGFTELFFEHSCLLVMRPREPAPPAADRLRALRRPRGQHRRASCQGRGAGARARVGGPAARRRGAFAGDGALEACERLLHDVMVGDPTLFTRAEQIERLWEICQPVLDDPPAPLPYARGSWGPEEALALPGPRGWRLPDA